MIALIKIRGKYLCNHLCSVYLSYFFIPSIIFIFLLLFLITIINKEVPFEGEKFCGKDLNITKVLFSNNIEFSKYNFSLVSDDEKDKKIIQEIIKSDIEWSYQESGIKKNNNIIRIFNKNEKYKIELIIKNNDNSIFYKKNLETFQYFDSFKYPNRFERIYLFNERVNKFIELQFLFAQFLIKKKGIPYLQRELIIELGQNSYPQYTIFNAEEVLFYFCILISFQFTITSYFFCMRMIDEKEKKLTKLLERQGISKRKYFFSRLLAYLVIIIPPLIIYILFYLFFFQFHIVLFIPNIILFVFSLYLFTYFLYICISKSQTGSILIKLINLSSSTLGIALNSEKCYRLSKIFSAIIPQINIYYCSNSIQKSSVFKKLSWQILWLKANKISYMESIIMYIVEIILYSFLSIIITKYKQSGLGFFEFLISCCKMVPRKINQKIENKIDEKVLNFEKHFQNLSLFNQQKKEQRDCLSIVNISKYFDSLRAVDNFNGDLFGNEIFCLLGHNGAGKTTLINMISGILDPSEGDIFYKGKSLVTNKEYLFKNIGVCHQEDIFFDYLTVTEHLEYMCEIKGSKANNEEIRNLINKIGLTEKSNSLCKTLSGGQ